MYLPVVFWIWVGAGERERYSNSISEVPRRTTFSEMLTVTMNCLTVIGAAVLGADARHAVAAEGLRAHERERARFAPWWRIRVAQSHGQGKSPKSTMPL
jgi:hypothetical protein